jgi:hypothetical protein
MIENVLQGARHDNDPSNPPARGFYSAISPFGAYATIMTVLNTCDGISCQRLPVFSASDVTYFGLAIGDQYADNRQEVNSNIANVANYRSSGSEYVKALSVPLCSQHLHLHFPLFL